ncbi:GEM-like protein 5 [Hibiscus syriacus]|uniref:GEM-like protein 5 n=1 Tax=Hibiscus syriacus TaxID=106335 RepID=A0A6A3CCT7_HIBSY|nr:GEM-like protein 5 [Hibiscus syriacus]KAE8724969.1 GEM-like protein 5 [Hibiscus syriacus]
MSEKPEENTKVEESHEPLDDESQGKPGDDGDHHHQQPCANEPPSSSEEEEDKKQWGTHVMGPPATPVSHPDNQKAAASWTAGDHQRVYELPYLVYSPEPEKPAPNSFELAINVFNGWSRKAETVARNIWHNLKTGPSVTDAAWGKVNLTAKAITEGGFESMFRKIFTTDENEKLNKAFACYLSTATGPVAGTLYLSTARVAFCSDRPLSFTAPSGQETWSYYKVMIPLAKIGAVYPVVIKENPTPESYIELITVDSHDFWFMGFVKFEKASSQLLNIVQDFKATEQNLAQPPLV